MERHLIHSVCSAAPLSRRLSGVRVVLGPARRALGDLLVAVRRRHGHGARGAAARHVGLLPALPDPQRLPENGRYK